MDAPHTSSANASDPSAESRARALSDDRVRHLLHRGGVGYLRADAAGRVLEVTDGLATLLGYASGDELVGTTLSDDLFVDGAALAQLITSLDDETPSFWMSTRFQRRDGSALAVRVSLRAVEASADQEASLEAVVEDASERSQRDALLRRNERMASLGMAVASAAHELNNPLTAIHGFAQWLLRGAHDSEARTAIETIQHEANRAARIVRDLLLLARQRESERRTRVSLDEVATYIVRTRRYALETHGIACRLELAPSPTFVLGHRLHLEQVAMNLVSNAEQSIRLAGADGRAAGSIIIRIRHEDGHAILEVDDDGPGIQREALAQMWKAFWTSRDGDGTGLGLTVVHGIVADHGGTITAANRPEGGARFAVRLPRLMASSHALLAASSTNRQALDILVADRDAHNLTFLTHFLSSRGHAPITATSFEHAARLAERMSFDVVICEARLLDSTGALDRFRALPGFAGARVVVAAGEAETTAHLPVPLPPRTSVVLRPYDLEELRLLLED